MYRKLGYFVLGRFGILKNYNSDKLVILTYHRVLEKDDGKKGMVVLRNSFEKQIKYISENYNVIGFKCQIKQV